jgi:hypothetical protein
MHGQSPPYYPLTEMVYYSPQHFTCVYTSPTTLTLAGLPFVPSDAQFAELRVATAAGAVNVYPSVSYKFAYNAGTGVLTVTGGNFTATDSSYRLVIVGEVRGYSGATDSMKTTEQSPVNNVVIEESLIDTTTVATGTDYLPSSDGIALLGYRDLTLTGKLIDADGAITLTFEGTNDEDATAASRDWISIYGIRTDKAAGLGYVNTVAIHDSTETFAIDFDRLNYKYFRVKYVVLTDVAASNTIIVKCRRQA